MLYEQKDIPQKWWNKTSGTTQAWKFVSVYRTLVHRAIVLYRGREDNVN